MSPINQNALEEMQLSSHLHILRSLVARKEKCDQDGCKEMYVSTWEKTGIPVIISVALFFIAFVVLFFIIRKRRQKTKKSEEEAQAKIDLDDMEERAEFQAGRRR